MSTIKHKGHEEESFIAQTISRYLPYWPLFLALIVVAMGAAWGYLHLTRPVYESSARILIKDEKKGTEDSKALEELNLLSTKKIIENEMEVIQSRTLLDQVVANLNLHIPITEKDGLINYAAYVSSPVHIEGAYNPQAGKPEKIFFTCNPQLRQVLVNGVPYPIGQWVSTPYGRLKFISNLHFTGKLPAGKLYFQMQDPKRIVASIQDRLKVTTNSRQSSILNITLRDEVPERGEDILNELLQSYNKAMINDKNILAANTLASVEARLKSVEHDLDSIERRSEQYKATKGVVDISEQGRLFLQNVSANDQRMGDVSTQLAVLDQVEQYVRSKNNDGGIVPSTAGINDPVLPNLIDKLYTLELERESTKKTTGENHPVMIGITDKIEKIKPAILENIQSQRKSLEASSRNIASTNRSYASLLQTMPQKERELIEINRQQSIKSSIYTFLLQKREETALTHASTVSDSRIIDGAQSGTAPVSPKAKVIYLTALLAALGIAAAFIAIRETLTSKVMFRDEIYRLTVTPVLGEISSNSSKVPVVTGEHQKTFIAEQFRKLRSSLSFIGITARKKRMLVTSAISGEGKSFVSLNLAISLALTGKKVVLIDADLHNPSLHQKLGMDQGRGLADYLKGEAGEEDIVQQATAHANLCFISTGTLPHNPSELLMSTRMENLLNLLDGQFDYIVADSAPVGLVTDAYVIAPYFDATVFVIRHKYTPRAIVERMDEENKLNHLGNTGIVFNDVQVRGFGNKYGYGYGHGYIYNNSNYYQLNKAGS